jgi:hypothetical protein
MQRKLLAVNSGNSYCATRGNALTAAPKQSPTIG